MRGRLNILVLMVAAALAAACRPEPALTLSRTQVDAAPEGGVYGVTIVPAGDWTADVDADWVSCCGGDKSLSSRVLIITVAPNDLSDVRTATVKVTVGDLTQEVLVSQPRRPSRILRIVHSRPGFSAPGLFGEGVYGTIAWGDGAEEAYSGGAVHEYSAQGNHEFVMEAYEAVSVSMSDFTDVVKIDLSDF